ncbi:TatD family hydrolase [Desulfoplanes formicivorans]|nr:TatD family hydrolase [Desulfoplanes formicivorans]
MQTSQINPAHVSLVDAHLHADILHHVCPKDFAAYAGTGAGISWSFVYEPDGWESFPPYFDSLEKLCSNPGIKGFCLYYLVGVHPRSLPSPTRGWMDNAFWSSLESHVLGPSCLGLGELGLETGSDGEVAVLKEQLSWASSLLPQDKRIGIHTPRKDKARMTRQILKLVAEVPTLQPRIVIDHVNEENLEMVMETGLMMGMTMQQGKMTPEKLADILDRYPQLAHRIMLNSDAALKTDPLYQTAMSFLPGISADIHARLIRENACSFWGIAV